MKISVETDVTAPINEVWRAYTTPDDIRRRDNTLRGATARRLAGDPE